MAKWPQNGVAAQMWLLSSSFTHWARLVFMAFSLVDWFKWKWQCDSSKPWPGSAIPEILQHPETLPPYSPPLAPPPTSSSTAGVAQTQLIQIVFMLSLCLYLCLSVCMSCMSALFTCLSVCLSLCLSIRLNSPSNCSVLYDLFRSITRSLVTESGSDITLWFCFDLLCLLLIWAAFRLLFLEFFIASSCLVRHAQRGVAGRGVLYQLLPKYFIRIVLSVLTREPCIGELT